MPDCFPTRKGRGRSIDVGLDLRTRPFLSVAVIGSMPVLLKVDERLSHCLQLSGNRRIGRIKLLVDCLS